MSGYRHFIAYIYEYEEGKKTRNAGFVKVNMRNDICQMQMKIQTGKREAEEYTVYGFLHKEPWVYAVPVGAMVSRSGLYEGRIAVREDALQERGASFGLLSGLWIQKKEENEEGHFYLTVWDERSVDWKRFVTSLPKEKEESETKEGETEEQKTEDPEPEKSEIEVQQTSKSSEDLDRRWEQFQYHYPKVTPFADDDITQCIRIAPKDIAYLGMQERPYCISPFVQQKFMKYHHLLLGKHKNGAYILAVPGVNRNVQDQNLAAMYGFPEYKEAKEENYGYWYHFISLPCNKTEDF